MLAFLVVPSIIYTYANVDLNVKEEERDDILPGFFSVFAGVAKQDTTVELDQFGRDKNLMKEEARKRRMANCAGRKRRRRERRDKTSTPSAEGLSTDDEEIESDLQRMALELGVCARVCVYVRTCLLHR